MFRCYAVVKIIDIVKSYTDTFHWSHRYNISKLLESSEQHLRWRLQRVLCDAALRSAEDYRYFEKFFGVLRYYAALKITEVFKNYRDALHWRLERVWKITGVRSAATLSWWFYKKVKSKNIIVKETIIPCEINSGIAKNLWILIEKYKQRFYWLKINTANQQTVWGWAYVFWLKRKLLLVLAE